MYTETLGPWANTIFLLGAFIVLFSTLFSALAAWTRIHADAYGRAGLYNFDNHRTRKRAIAILAWVFPFLWTAVFYYYREPVYMVVVGGVATCLILLLVVTGALYFRYRRTVAEMKPGRFYDVAFLVSVLAIVAMAGLTIYKTADKILSQS